MIKHLSPRSKKEINKYLQKTSTKDLILNIDFSSKELCKRLKIISIISIDIIFEREVAVPLFPIIYHYRIISIINPYKIKIIIKKINKNVKVKNYYLTKINNDSIIVDFYF